MAEYKKPAKKAVKKAVAKKVKGKEKELPAFMKKKGKK